MAAVERKSLIPVKETIIVPYNNGAVYSTGNTITILFGAGDAHNCLIQDSFFQFDYKITVANAARNSFSIRDLNQIFDWVEIIYQGKQVYIQNFNQQAKFIDWVRQGGNYLDTQIYSGITSKNAPYTRIKLTSSAGGVVNNITGCIIRLASLFDIFEKITELPVCLLDNQIQINLHLADPYTYLIAPSSFSGADVKNFSTINKKEVVITNFSIDRFEFHLKDKVEISPEMNREKTYKFDYTMNQIALRGVRGSDFPASSTLNLPFNIVTENVSTMGIYFYKDNVPSITYRPELINVNFKYGNNTSPFSPINVDNADHPGIYKQFCDDSFDISTSYFGTTNYDYDMSYPTCQKGANIDETKSDAHIVLVTDFIPSGDLLGSASKFWNSQYIFQANASAQGMQDSTACMWVESKYMAFIRDGKFDSVNI